MSGCKGIKTDFLIFKALFRNARQRGIDMMVWKILIISLCLTSVRSARFTLEYMESLRTSGRDKEFARLMGVDVKLVRPKDEERLEGSRMNRASPWGDMLLAEEQERQGMNFKSYPNYKWPDGVVYYTIMKSDYTRKQQKMIRASLSELNRKVKNINIIEITDPPTDDENFYYIQIFSGDGCWSSVGCIRKSPQGLSLQKNGCLSNGTIQHEFLHALGLTHEHNREDRDKYLTVLWNNIDDDWKSQFKKVEPPVYSNVLKYDYDSVMHYEMKSPERDDDAFQLPPGIDRNRLGQDIGVSRMDIKKLNYMYRK